MNDVRRAKLADRPLEAADQGREQSSPTGSLRPPAAATVGPVPEPAAARMTLADHSLRRGAACCARCSVADRRYPLADTLPGFRQGTAFYTEPRRAAVPESAFANGFRQGTALAVPNDIQTSGVSTPEVPGTNSPTTYAMGFSHSTLATSHCFRISTRFCPESRSHTKHTTKPCLPGSRIAHSHARSS